MFRIFEESLSEVAQQLIVEVVKNSDVSKFLNPDGRSEDDKNICELFLHVKEFSDTGMAIVNKLDFKTLKFYDWFSNDANHICKCTIFSAYARY